MAEGKVRDEGLGMLQAPAARVFRLRSAVQFAYSPAINSGSPFQNLFQVALAVQDGNYLQRSRIRPIDNHVMGEFRDGPKAHRERRDVLPPGSHQGMFGQPPTGRDDFHFHPVGSVPVVLCDNQMASMSSVACGVN
jgi:hypothetical protein